MTSRPDCVKCPHPASAHRADGCRPSVGMCACDVPRADLTVASSPWETSTPTPPPAPAPVMVDDVEVSDLEPEVVVFPPPVPPAPEPEPEPEPAPVVESVNVLPYDDPRPSRSRYDWVAIKRRYIEGVRSRNSETIDWPSLSACAVHFGVDPTRVRERSAAEGWVEQRRQFQSRLEAQRQQAKIAGLVKAGQDLDTRAVDAAKLGLQLTMTVLASRAQEVSEARAKSGGRGAGGLDALELTRLASAVDLFHKIGLRAVGDPQVTRVELTGAGGAPIEIATELRRDDPNRLAGVLSVLQQAGLGDLFAGGDPEGALGGGGDGDGGAAALPSGR